MSDKVKDNELINLREQLDKLDGELASLLVRRLETAERIGAYKREAQKKLTDAERELCVLQRAASNVPERFEANIKSIFAGIIEESKAVQRRGLNVYLIGMPDSGKTRLGKRLTKLLDMPLIDTDKYIMSRMSMSIDEIFSKLGEESFRSMETMVLKELVKTGGYIVAAGGGLPLWNGNDRLMKNSGVTVFLDRKLERLLDQTTTNRPLLAGDVNGNVRRLYAERHSGYAAIADVVIDPDESGAAERAAALIKEFIQKT